MRDFSSPPSSFAPLLTWIWNNHLEETALRDQLQSFAENGFGGVVIRPGQVLSPTYLSDEWMQLVRACIHECRSCGLALWLTDEGPAYLGTSAGDGSGTGRSGTAGGRVPREQAPLRSHYLKFQIVEVARDATAEWRFPAVSGELLYAVAVPIDAGTRRLDFTTAVVLTNQPLERASRLLTRMGEDVRVLIFSQERAGYIDLLNPEASQCFLDYTHERYRIALGSDFAGITGFWNFRPTLRDNAETDELQRLPWSPLLLESFAVQPGYELLEWLPALVADLGDDASRLRQDFWSTVSRMSQAAFWQPLAQWAEDHNVQYSGFVEGQQPLNPMVANVGDASPVYSTLQCPAVEACGLECGGSGLDLGRGLHARVAASQAALNGAQSTLGAPRVLAEAWRSAGWSATPGERLPSLHHLLRQGINSVVAHGTFSSLGDALQTIQAPSEAHQPYAPQWKNFSDYIARCSYVLAHGRPGARVAVLWPIRSAWAHHHPKGHRLTRWVEEDLYATALMLDDLHFEFLFVTEEDLQSGRFEDGKVLCGPAQLPFELIVLPSVTALHRNTWAQLENFLDNGGKVACLGLLPRFSERGRDREFEAYISKKAMVTVGDLYEAYAEMEDVGGQAPLTAGYPITHENDAGGRLSCYQPRLNENVKDALLRVRKILKESITPELETQAPNILYTRRVLTKEESIEDDAITNIVDDYVEEPAAIEPMEPEALEEDWTWDQPFDWGEPSQSAVEDEVEKSLEDEDALSASLDWSEEVAEEESVGATHEGEIDVPLRLEEALPETGYPTSAGGDVFFIFNAGDEAQRINLRLRPTQDGSPHILDACTGEIHRHAVWMQFPEIEGGGLSLAFEMAPQESKLLWIRPYASDEEADVPHVEASTFVVENFDGRVASGYATEGGSPRIAVRRGERLLRQVSDPIIVPPPILLPDSWQASRLGPNSLSIADWHWQRGRHLPGDQRWFFGRDNWQALPPRATSSQSTSESTTSLQNQTRLNISGIVTFRTTFELAELPSSLFLQWNPLDVPCDLYLNGELLEARTPAFAANPPWNDARWQWFELDELLEIGENTLSCVADCREKSGAFTAETAVSRVPGVPRLVGDFSLTTDAAITGAQSLLLGSGSWHNQGLPFYSGALDYKQWIKVPGEWNRCRVFLEISRTRDVCGVWLNGRYCGVAFAPPHRFDVTPFVLRNASNEVRLRVWNTAEAALQGHEQKPHGSGLLGPVRLVAYPLVHSVLEPR